MQLRLPTSRAVAPTCLLALAFLAARPFQDEPVVVGEGENVYEWVKGWGGELTDGGLGNTHGCVLVDRDGRILANTDTENAVVIFSPDGKRQAAWGKELAGGLHGMALVDEGGKQVLYLAHTGRHQVLKATLDGEILWSVGWPQESKIYASENEYMPTSVAVRPDGGFYVADGYGKSWIHQYDAERKYVRSFGGPGSEPGKLATPHGIFLDTRGKAPVLLVADRENGRLQSFDLDGNFLAVVATDLKRPCHIQGRGSELVVPELAGGVVLLDENNKFVARLGENADPARRANNGVPHEQWSDGQFLSPHCAAFGPGGEIYVLDWNASGRLSKLAPRR
jgi:DNA-binding beta-propeller fold protein YncE